MDEPLYVQAILDAKPAPPKDVDDHIGMGRVWLAGAVVWIIFGIGLYFTLIHN